MGRWLAEGVLNDPYCELRHGLRGGEARRDLRLETRRTEGHEAGAPGVVGRG